MKSKCPYCKKNIEAEASFCIHCGGDLRESQQNHSQNNDDDFAKTKKSIILVSVTILVVCVAGLLTFVYTSATKRNDESAMHMDEQYLHGFYDAYIKPSRPDASYKDWIAKIKDNDSYKQGMFNTYVKPANKDATYEDWNSKIFGSESDSLAYLYNVLHEKQFYTKSLDEFKIRYGTVETQKELYDRLYSANFYTKDFDSFSRKYFNSINATTERLSWYRNSLFGFSFETPKKVTEQVIKIPEGYDKIITAYKGYLCEQNSLSTFFFYGETNTESYDLKIGLKGCVSNIVNMAHGSDLELTYTKPDTILKDLRCSGSFILNEKKYLVDGYAYWNGKGKFFLLMSIGSEDDAESMNRIVESVRVAI